MKWFKHDSDANGDPKLEKLLMKYGAEGYALYWLCIELIAAPIDKHNLTFELEHDAEILAHRLKMDTLKVEEIMHFMVNQKLFEVEPTTKRITCMKLALRIENAIVKHPELKLIQQNLGSSGIIPDNPGKVGPDIDTDTDIDKEKDKKKIKVAAATGFDDFWSVYPKKVKKKQALEIWKRKRLHEITKQLTTDVQHRMDFDDRWRDGYIPDPTTYLNGERWEDEVSKRVEKRTLRDDIDDWVRQAEEKDNVTDQ